MNNILVTGGAGYIGSHACKALKERGFTPIAFDNLSTGWEDAVKYGPFVFGDLTKLTDIEPAFQKYRPVAVMHFAARSQVGESILNPGAYWQNNVIGSLNLLRTCIRENCLNVVFSSTCATYGEHDNLILSENSVQTPMNSYGASKLAVENMLKNFSESDDIRFIIFRYFNVAGADKSAEIGEFHMPETHLIPLILDAMINDKQFTIHGTDYSTPDGTCVRDYVHVSDLIEAHILGLERLLRGEISDIFNLGTGKGFSVREVIDAVSAVTGKSIQVFAGDRRRGDCSKLVSGSAKAKAVLGWSPENSSLHKMIEDAWRWHKHGHYRS